MSYQSAQLQFALRRAERAEAEVMRLRAVIAQFQTVIDGITRAFEQFERADQQVNQPEEK